MFYFDAHCDTLSAQPALLRNKGQFDLSRAAARGPGAQLMAAYGGGQLAQLDHLHDEIASLPDTDFILLPAVEGGDTVRTLSDLDVFWEREVRAFGLTWNHDNALAGGCMGEGGGLTELGACAVAAFEERNVLPDLAHASARSFFDALSAARRPLLVSHACCAALCPHPRNLSDTQLRALAQNGGVLGIAFHSPFLASSDRAAIDDVVAHILHACKIMGESHVAIGSDFDGGITAPKGLCGTEDIPQLIKQLSDLLPPAAVRAVAGENLRRLFRV